MQQITKWLKRKLRRRYREWQIANTYNQSAPVYFQQSEKPAIIHVLDNNRNHGGLLDRIKGIVSSYLLAESLGYDFKVYVNTESFNLFKFLTPLKPETVCTPSDFLKVKRLSKPLYLYNYQPASKAALLTLFRGNYHQYHVYGNVDYTKLLMPENVVQNAGDYWGTVFRRMYRFSNNLELLTQAQIGTLVAANIVGIHARFMSLLGDFEEVIAVSLPEEEQQKLLEKSLRKVLQVVKSEPSAAILIVSDSSRFLNACKAHAQAEGFAQRLIVDSENIGHIDVHHQELILQKAFVDFYLLCRCSRIYQIVLDGMYHSQFSRYASFIANCSLEKVKET